MFWYFSLSISSACFKPNIALVCFFHPHIQRINFKNFSLKVYSKFILDMCCLQKVAQQTSPF